MSPNDTRANEPSPDVQTDDSGGRQGEPPTNRSPRDPQRPDQRGGRTNAGARQHGEQRSADNQSGGQRDPGPEAAGGRQRAPAGGGPHSSRGRGGTSLEPTVAAALSYLVVWVSGLVFLLVEKENDFVRFHAAQSVVVFGGLTVGWIVVSNVFAPLFAQSSGLFWLVQLGQLLGFVLWIVLLYVSYNGRWFRVPVAADIADDIANRSNQPRRSRQPREQERQNDRRRPPEQPREAEDHQASGPEGQSSS